MNYVENFLSRLDSVSESGTGWNARCPCKEHGDRTPSMSISLSDVDQKILVKCFGGCTLDSILEAIDLEHQDLWPSKDDLNTDSDSGMSLTPLICTSQATDLGLCNQVYSALKAKLPINTTHRDMLRNRGLKDEQIDRNGYRSLSFFDLRQKVLPALRKEFGDQLLNVPGFIDKNGTITAVDVPAGIMIPIRDLDEGIVAFQVRCDAEGKGKYRWFSGGEQAVARLSMCRLGSRRLTSSASPKALSRLTLPSHSMVYRPSALAVLPAGVMRCLSLTSSERKPFGLHSMQTPWQSRCCRCVDRFLR